MWGGRTGQPSPICGAALTWSPGGLWGSVMLEGGRLVVVPAVPAVLAVLAVLAMPPVLAVLAMCASCQPGTDCPIRKEALM